MVPSNHSKHIWGFTCIACGCLISSSYHRASRALGKLVHLQPMEVADRVQCLLTRWSFPTIWASGQGADVSPLIALLLEGDSMSSMQEGMGMGGTEPKRPPFWHWRSPAQFTPIFPALFLKGKGFLEQFYSVYWEQRRNQMPCLGATHMEEVRQGPVTG